MSPCPLCGYGISTFAISLDVEFIMCGNENCVYPFAEDSKVVRASLIDKRSPEAIASARKRKAQSFVPSDTKAIAKKSKLDGQRKPAPPMATSAVPSSSLANTLTKAISATPIKPPSTLIIRAPATGVNTAPTPTLTAVPTIASTAPSGVSTTHSEQFTLSDLLSVDAPLAAEVGSAATRDTGYTTSATWNDFLSSIPDFDIVTPENTSSAVPTAAQDASSSRTAAKPAKLSVASVTNFATPASTPLSSPTELLSASDLLSVDAIMTPLTASTNTPAATPTDSTTAEDAKEISDFLSSIPDFDTNTTANHSSNEALNLDEFHDLSLDFLHADPWTPPVTPPNQPLAVDALSSKQSLDMSAANLESLLFGNDYEIAFDQEFSADLEAVLQG